GLLGANQRLYEGDRVARSHRLGSDAVVRRRGPREVVRGARVDAFAGDGGVVRRRGAGGRGVGNVRILAEAVDHVVDDVAAHVGGAGVDRAGVGPLVVVHEPVAALVRRGAREIALARDADHVVVVVQRGGAGIGRDEAVHG